MRVELETHIKKRNYCLDFIKGIACVCVVFMHCEFPGLFGVVVQCISRFCVPFFFMVSGYFAYREELQFTCSPPQYKKIFHILKITILASIFYLIIELVKYVIKRNVIVITKSHILYWFLFNQPFLIAGQLWFLFALLYVYVLFAVIERFNLYKIAYFFIPILILAYIILAQGMHLVGKPVPNMIYRNFLIEGFPLFMLGHFLHFHEKRIIKSFNDIVLIIGFLLFTLLCLVERYFLGRDFGVNIFTFPQVICLFIIGIKKSERFESNMIRKIGTNLSMFVYIIHPFVWHTMEYGYKKLGWNESMFALYCMPLFVLLITLLLSVCTYSVFKIKKSNVAV